ncbi:Tyrosine recombinase XerC [subsurface metagenome]
MKKHFDLSRILDHEEEEKLLLYLATKDIRDWIATLLGLRAGLRLAEILGLQVGDVLIGDDITMELTLRKEITKGHKVRDVPLCFEVRQGIKNILRAKRKKGESLQPEAPLFCNQKGNAPYGHRDFQRHLHAAGRNVLKRRLTVHDLRHSFATRYARKGNLAALQHFLGHASLETTGWYLHPNKQDLRDLVGP